MKTLKTRIIFLIAALSAIGLVGCGGSGGKRVMTNADIATEVQLCKDKNLKPVPAYIWGGPQIFAIVCTPQAAD